MKTAPASLICAALALGLSLSRIVAACNTPPGGDSAASETATASAAPIVEPVGVPECDAYLKLYEACLRGPLAAAANPEATLRARRESFRVAAMRPNGKSGLKARCKSLLGMIARDPSCAH